MSYVMVPVPEDCVQEVMQHIVRLMNQAALEDWDESAVTKLFELVDEPTRALLSTVAVAVRGGGARSLDEASAIVELNPRELMGLLREVNEIAGEESRRPLLVQRIVTETLPNGRTRDVRVLAMDDDVADLVYAADRAHLLGQEHPLGPGGS
jgi:hypothetical protein